MRDDIAGYLADNAPVVIYQQLAAAFILFDRLNVEDFEEPYDQLLMMVDNADAGDTVTQMVNVTRQTLTQILLEHGVVLVPETQIDMANDIVAGLLDIQTYENAVDILQTVDLDMAPEEVFSELIALVAPHTADDLLTHVFSVSPMFVVRLRALVRDRDRPMLLDEDREMHRKMVQALVRLMASDPRHQFEVTRMIKSGMAIGLPFKTYVDQIGRDFDNMDVRDCSYELVACALISRDGHSNPVVIIKDNLDRLITDLTHLTKIAIGVADIMAVQTT